MLLNEIESSKTIRDVLDNFLTLSDEELASPVITDSFFRPFAMLEVLIHYQKNGYATSLNTFFVEVVSISDIEKLNSVLLKKSEGLNKEMKKKAEAGFNHLRSIFKSKNGFVDVANRIQRVVEFLLSREYLKNPEIKSA